MNALLPIFFLLLSIPLLAQDTPDPYAWLEDVHSPQTRKWLREQEKACTSVLDRMRRKELGFTNLNRYSYTKFDLPAPEGKGFYKLMYNRLGRPPVLYRQRDLRHEPRVIFDPDLVSSRDKLVVSDFEESANGAYLAVSYGRNGSDWQEVSVVRTKNGTLTGDHLNNVKFSRLAWFGDGFFYLSYPRRGEFVSEGTPTLLYHSLGETQTDDLKVFGRQVNALVELDFKVTPTEEFLIIEETLDDEVISYYYADLRQGDIRLQPLLPRLNATLDVVANFGDTLVFLTNHGSGPNTVNWLTPDRPTEWHPLLPPVEEANLDWCRYIAGKLVCDYRNFLTHTVVFYSPTGEVEHTLAFDEGYSIGGFSAEGTSNSVVFYYGNYFTPPIVHALDLDTYITTLVDETKVTFRAEDFVVRTVEYPSSDGTAVPLTLVSRKDIRRDGSNPTLLKTYGGFGSVHEPHFDPGLVYFLEAGGVFAYAHVRGEGTLGNTWARAGRRTKKQNGIDDLIAAAEYLIREDYTDASHLGITGASHGGLMVGAALVQRPELFRAAVPIVGVFDMLNFEKYTVGVFHRDEFGSVEDLEEATYLRAYSPYHNVRPGVNYPTTLVLTSAGDNRVPPFHSYKFAARLQDNPGQENPILLRVEDRAGHYGANTLDGELFESADIYSFLLNVLR